MEVERLAALVVAAIAVVTDVRTRRIPNLLTFGSALVALACWGWAGGLQGLGHGALGWGAGVTCPLPLFAIGGMGADNLLGLRLLGVDRIAVSAAILGAPDPRAAAQAIQATIAAIFPR